MELALTEFEFYVKHAYNRTFFLFAQTLKRALLELRAELVATAEQQVIASAAQKEETLNVQVLIDKHTKDLKVGPVFFLYPYLS